MGDYQVTLMGLLGGQALSQVDALEDQVQQTKTYAVLAYTRADGQAITEDVPDLTVTPLVEGYAPWLVNAWTLGGNAYTFAQDGTLYYLVECDSVEPFADHIVYLAVYPGTHTVPSAQLFSFGEDGAISYQPGQAGALFTLPLDTGKAAPAAAAQLLGPEAFEPSFEELPEDGVVSQNDVQFTCDDAEDKEILLIPAS